MRWSASRGPRRPPTAGPPIGRAGPGVLLLAGMVLLAGCQQGSSLLTGEWQRDGRAVTTERVETYRGDGHCDLDEVIFLHVMWPPTENPTHTEDRLFVRDPGGRLGVSALKTGFQEEGKLPADATATGYVNGGTGLWFAASDQDSRAYLVADDGRVEVWPRAIDPLGCD